MKSILDLEAFRESELNLNPFPFTALPNFLRPEHSEAISREFPAIHSAGSIPVGRLRFGETFGRLIQELQGPELREAISKKFGMDLQGRPTFITVRGMTRKKDGRIHTDTKSKLVTVLMYFNPAWERAEGRLRILRNGNDLEDFVVEIPPTLGACLIFKVTDNCWHGHKPFEGTRKAIQLNYLTDEAALKKHESKHNFSAKLKDLTQLFRKESR